MIVQLLILVLSTLSMGCVAALLRAPWLPEQRPVLAPVVLLPALDEGYHDTIGLT